MASTKPCERQPRYRYCSPGHATSSSLKARKIHPCILTVPVSSTCIPAPGRRFWSNPLPPNRTGCCPYRAKRVSMGCHCTAPGIGGPSESTARGRSARQTRVYLLGRLWSAEQACRTRGEMCMDAHFRLTATGCRVRPAPQDGANVRAARRAAEPKLQQVYPRLPTPAPRVRVC